MSVIFWSCSHNISFDGFFHKITRGGIHQERKASLTPPPLPKLQFYLQFAPSLNTRLPPFAALHNLGTDPNRRSIFTTY